MISDKLLTLRKRAGMSQQEVADTIGVSRQTISNWELGQGSPALDRAAELARLYGVTLNDLASEDVEIVSPEHRRGRTDLHVLKRLKGRGVQVELDDGRFITDAVLLDVGEDWMRLEQHERVGRFGSPKSPAKRCVKLIDLSGIVGITVTGT